MIVAHPQTTVQLEENPEALLGTQALVILLIPPIALLERSEHLDDLLHRVLRSPLIADPSSRRRHWSPCRFYSLYQSRRAAATGLSREKGSDAPSKLVNHARSLSEYLLVLSHGRWISLGFGLFGLGPTLCAHYPPQSTPTLQERRQIFKRLWVKQISCHSADTFSRPRNRNLRIPRADLIMPNTGSTMCLRAA